MKLVASLALAAATFAVATTASAQFAKPEDALKYRQSVMFVMSQHFGRIGAMVNGKAPYDAKAAVDSAEVVSMMSHLPWQGFAASTRDLKPTKAKPDIWTEEAKFKEGSEKLQDATAKLVAAAKTNNVDNLKTAFGATGQTCKGCHDNFRSQ
jgi:cytochrome c556